MSILVQNVVKLFGEQKALNDVSFEIKTGEIVGFIGPNGAGKSTMMRISTGYIPSTSGTVLVNGMNILEHPIEVKRLIGYLPENNPLYLNMYIKEYLTFVAGTYNVPNKSKRVEDVINIVGITPEKHKKIGALSKGYRQRVGLAQALVHDPAVLILDEPTTGLDPNQIVEIRNLISEIGKQKTVMLSTHIMQEVEAICHRIIIINKGQIVANEESANIYSHSKEEPQIILVEFDKKVEEKHLLTINGVCKAQLVKDNNWIVESNTTDDIRSAIFNFAVANKLAVLSMQKKEKNLEQVFQELTK